MADEPLILNRTVWKGEQPGSPLIAEGQFGLDFAAVPAEGPFGPTLGLLCTARLPGYYGDLYGGRFGGATQVIAVDAVNGAVYAMKAERLDAAPLGPLRVAVHPEGVQLIAATSHFNVDLGGHLILPPDEGRYHVFLWLDKLLSPVHSVTLPESDTRPRNPAAQPVPAETAGVHVQYHPAGVTIAPHLVEAKLLVGAPDDKGLPVLTVEVTIGADLIPAEPVLKGDEHPMLTLFMLGQESRLVASLTVPLDLDEARGAPITATFRPLASLPVPENPQRLFVLALFGDVCANVLNIEPAQWVTLP